MNRRSRRHLVPAWLSASVVAAALVFCSLASSAANPVSPEPGAITSSQPVFTWTLPPDEESEAVYIANRPDTGPEGAFLDDNVVMTGLVEDVDSTTWSPSEPLFAGRHWWIVETFDADFASVYSAGREFTVATEVRLVSAKLARFALGREVRADLEWVTNAPEVVAELRFLRRGRIVGLVRRRSETRISQDADRTSLTWRTPRKIRRGVRLDVVVRVVGAGASATKRSSVRAP